MGHTTNNWSHLGKISLTEIWITFRKMIHTVNSGSHCENKLTFITIGHSVKIGYIWEKGSHCIKWVTSCKNGPHWKCVTLWKVSYTVKNRSARYTYVGAAFFLLFWTLQVKAGFQLKAVFMSLNVAFVPISRSRFKQHQIPPFITYTNVLRFCVNFRVIFGHFLTEIFLEKDRLSWGKYEMLKIGKLKFKVKN